MNRRTLLASMSALAAAATLPRAALAQPPSDPVNVSAEAEALYRNALVFDANLNPPVQDKFPFPSWMLDMVRQSGVTACKTSLGGLDESFEDTVGEIAFFQRIFEEYPDVFLQVRRHADFARAKREGRMGVLLSFEAVAMLEDKAERIELFRDLGVRVMQLSYNKASPFGSGVLADPNGGLTPLGAKAVEAMNTQGVALDLSHSNEKTSFDALKVSPVPALITHAGCAAIHVHPRNKSDALLRAVAEKGGVVGIYDLCYLTPSPKQPALHDYMAHMTHALKVCGEDHVGIGSDSALGPWDTSPTAMAAFQKNEAQRIKTGVAAPEEDRPLYVIGLNTPRRSEVIADALLKRGYKARVAEKVLGLNFTGALDRIWRDDATAAPAPPTPP
jgi:membrane dipeptidase